MKSFVRFVSAFLIVLTCSAVMVAGPAGGTKTPPPEVRFSPLGGATDLPIPAGGGAVRGQLLRV
jgi:hypothetical protein